MYKLLEYVSSVTALGLYLGFVGDMLDETYDVCYSIMPLYMQ